MRVCVCAHEHERGVGTERERESERARDKGGLAHPRLPKGSVPGVDAVPLLEVPPVPVWER